MKSNLSGPESLHATALFAGLCEQTGGWIELALAEAGLPDVGDDLPDAPANAHEAAALLTARWLESGAVETFWEEASDPEREVLRAGITRPRISRGTLVRFAVDRGHSPAQAEMAIARLQRQAILLPAGGPASAAFQVPREIARRVQALARGEGPEPLSAAPTASTTSDHGSAFVDDFTTMLAFLRRGAYRTTRDGQVHASDLRKIATELMVPEEIPAAEDLDAGPIRTGLFPTRLGLILDLAERLHLVRTEPGRLKIETRRTRTWLSRGSVEVHRDLVRAACREDWPYAEEVSCLAAFLDDTSPGTWFRLDDVADTLEGSGDFMGMRPDDVRVRLGHAATYLCWMGVAAVSPEEEDPSVVALTALGQQLLEDPNESDVAAEVSVEEAMGMLAILPNFEVLLPATADLSTRWELETIADRTNRSRGPMRTYRLSREALLAAMKSGLTLRGVLTFLTTRSEGLPENVRVSLEDWSGSYGAYYFMQPTLLVCKDAAAAAAASANPRIAERLVGMLTPEILILDGDAVDAVRNALEMAGTMPRPGLKSVPIGGPLAGAEAAALKRARAGRRRRAGGAQTRRCSIEDCDRVHAARGLCATHYQQARRGKLDFPS